MQDFQIIFLYFLRKFSFLSSLLCALFLIFSLLKSLQPTPLASYFMVRMNTFRKEPFIPCSKPCSSIHLPATTFPCSSNQAFIPIIQSPAEIALIRISNDLSLPKATEQFSVLVSVCPSAPSDITSPSAFCLRASFTRSLYLDMKFTLFLPSFPTTSQATLSHLCLISMNQTSQRWGVPWLTSQSS